jgi:DNA polymerase (family 10)
MPIRNSEIAELFKKIADLLEIDGANPFRVRAYRTAVRTVNSLGRDVSDLIAAQEDLTLLPGIGKELATKIKEIVATGRLSKLEELEKRIPAELHQVLKLPGLGPKKVKVLYDQLNIRSLPDLEKAARKGKIRNLAGFGNKSQERMLEEIAQRGQGKERIQWIVAEKVAASFIEYLRAQPTVRQIDMAGSFRRRQETVGDLDILVSCDSPAQIMGLFIRHEDVLRVIAQGETKSSVILRGGLQVDLRVIDPQSYGAALHYFTGSQLHNIALRRLARQRDLKINEYGVFNRDQRIAGQTEKDVFAALKLSYIEPELREDRGEIQAARQDRLPELVTLEDIRGDLHCHTDETDGHHSIEEFARAAALKGYEYIGITNHSRHLRIARGLDPEGVKGLIKKIDRLNQKLDDIVIFKSMEVDILKDGTLDLPDSILKELDFTICSVHSDFRLPRQAQTERLIRAMDNPYFTILGHPTGRLINQRPAYAVDLQHLIAAAAERGCFMELNANPDRLDMDDVHCKFAKEAGVPVAISTDAHWMDHLNYMRLGVSQARRGWLEAKDVLNTRGVKELKQIFNRSNSGI